MLKVESKVIFRKITMDNYKFHKIDSDDHVILLSDDRAIKVGTLRQQLSSSYRSLLSKLDYGYLSLSSSQEIFQGQITSIAWKAWPDEGIDCSILFLGSSDWNKGKLRVTASLEIERNELISKRRHITNERHGIVVNSKVNMDQLVVIKITLEFASDNSNFFSPEIPVSPLDEIRQQIREQEKREQENNL